jgi:hypothetical protein
VRNSHASPPAEPTYDALDPRGYMPDVVLAPLAERGESLNGKVVYVINSWPVGSGSELDDILTRIGHYLKKEFPEATIVMRAKPSPYHADDPEFWDEIVKDADVFVYGAAPSCATTTYALRYAGLLERRGKPGVPIIFDNLIEDARLTCDEIGMAVRWVAVPYPPGNISAGRTALIMKEVKAGLSAPLTRQERRTGVRKASARERIASRGTFDEIDAYFCARGLSDGLPLIPPTEQRLAAMLQGTKHDPAEVVTTTMWPAQWSVTVEKVAIVGVMAGCKPEYMPVLLATVEAFSACGSAIRSTNSFSYMRVVNGPVRREIGMNGGTYALGPGNRANATLGRFLSLAVTSLGGGQVGVNLMGTQGNVSSYAFCFPENEEASPWESFASEKGFGPGESTLTMFATGWSHCGNYLGGGIDDFARAMAQFTYPSGMVILTSPARAREWERSGRTKEDFKEYVWSCATLPVRTFRQDSYYKKFIEPELKGKASHRSRWPRLYLELPEDAVVPVYPRDGIHVVVVGADQNPMIQGWKADYPTTVSIDKWR